MKICYINPTFLLRRPISDLIGLLGDEHEITLFVPKKPFKKISAKWHSDGSLKKAKIYTYSAINIPFINFEWPIPITPMFFVNLVKVFKKNDVIHQWTYFYLNSFFAAFTSLFFRRKTYVLSCDTFPAYSFNPGLCTKILFKIYTFLFGRFLFSAPKTVHIYGKSMKKHALRAGVNQKKFKIFSTGIFLKKFSKAKKLSRSSESLLKLQNNDFVMLYAGLMVPRKGIDVLIKATKKLCENNKNNGNNKINPKLLLVGDGPSKEKYQKLVSDLGLKDNVLFTGWRKDIPSIMKSSDVLLLHSSGEGLPGIVMEGMASGLPVVSTSIPGTSDLITDGKEGYLSKFGDVNAFASNIEKIIKNKRLSSKLGTNAKNKIKDFNWNDLKEQYLSMYNEV